MAKTNCFGFGVFLRALALAGCAAALPLPAADTGGSVVVIYNKRLPESKEVADYYARRRAVPASQVLGFDLPTTETLTRKEYNEQLRQPLLLALQDNKLWTLLPERRIKRGKPGEDFQSRVGQSKIRYAALCYGVPTRILADPNWVEVSSDTVPPEMRRNGAAVESELACLPMPEPVPLNGPLASPFSGATNEWTLHPTNGILLVTRLDGPTPAIARGLVDKAIEAETNGLWGIAYFDARGITNGQYYLGDNWMRAAAQLTRQLGIETILDDKPETFSPGFPMSHIAIYAGWYDGNVSGPFTRPTVEFMPGAFAYHLHSFSAATIRSTTQNWVGPLLAKGATITLGAVDEPFLATTPDIVLFLSRLLYFGFSFGEATWAAQNAVSWQNIAVGDPLYRPFPRPFSRRLDALYVDLEKKRQTNLLEWSALRWVDWNMASKPNPDEGITFLDSQPLTRNSPVLLEKLGDLYWMKKRLSDALDTYEQALKHNPSPQQRLRLLLTLAQRRTQIGPDAAAFQWYQQVLAENPDYPDALKVYQQLLPLAQKLGKTDAVEKCERELKRLAPAPAK